MTRAFIGWLRLAPLTLAVIALAAAPAPAVQAHSGPPYPIASSITAGRYVVSVWTDPDTTDDDTPGGQFWIVFEGSKSAGDLPGDTKATVTVRPLDRAGMARTATAAPVRGDAANQFAGVILDHEGPFAVHVAIEGPLGAATVDAQADATYDLRPAPAMLIWYLVPFVLIGTLWVKLLLRRRGMRARPMAS